MGKKNYEVNLNEVLADYCKTKDKSLITERVYDSIKSFCIFIATPFMTNHEVYRNYDELMTICNIAIWNALEKYEPSKGSISTYLATCIRNAILMDIRKNKKHRNVQSLDKVINCQTKNNNDDIYYYELIEDRKASDFMNYDSDEYLVDLIEQSLRHLKKKSKMNDKMYGITLMYMEGKTQREIADELNFSQSYISRILRKAKDMIIDYIKLNDYSAPCRPQTKHW